MPNLGTKSYFEETSTDRLKGLGNHYQYGGEVERTSGQTVVLGQELWRYLRRRNPQLTPEALQQTVDTPTRMARKQRSGGARENRREKVETL